MEELQVYVQNIGEILDYEYDLTIEDAVSTLKYSNHQDWTVAEETALILVDDGNGISIKFPDKKKMNLDYCEAREVFIILMMFIEDKIEIRKSETIKTI